MWDGKVKDLEHQAIIPIVTREEMGSSFLELIDKIKDDEEYQYLFEKVYGTKKIRGVAITQTRLFESLAQYQYTLISANSKYDKVIRNEESFNASERDGFTIFQAKCAQCHKGPLFTDESYRNIGFPHNPNQDEAGRARVTGEPSDRYKFRVPSLRNIEYTAPYGSFGQFNTLREVVDDLDKVVLWDKNLDPEFKKNGGRIPLNEKEKDYLIAFLKTLSAPSFVGKE